MEGQPERNTHGRLGGLWRAFIAILRVSLSLIHLVLATAWNWRPGFVRSMTALRNFFLNTVVIATTVVLLWLTVMTIFKRSVIIEPIAVPPVLKDRGYTGEVAAQRIIDEISEIERSSQTLWSRTQVSVFDIGRMLNVATPGLRNNAENPVPGTQITVWDSNHSLPKVELPGAGISLDSLVSSIREILGIEDTRITGEITVVPSPPASPEAAPSNSTGGHQAPAQFIMRVRISTRGAVYPSKAKTVDATGVVHFLTEANKGKVISAETLAVATRPNEPTAKVDAIFPNVALQIVEQLDPYIAALYFKQNNNISDAQRMIDFCLTNSDHTLIPWALNLRASIAREAGLFDEAIEQFEWIDQHYPDFTLSRYNLALALRQKGEQDTANSAQLFSDALAAATEGISKDQDLRRRAIGYNDIGTILEASERYEEALAQFEKSAEADPDYSLAFYNAGRMHRQRKEFDAAVDKFMMAARLDPKYAWTYIYLIHVLDVRSHGADAMIPGLTRRAGALMGGLANVYASRGWIEFRDENWKSSLDWYQKAIGIDATNPNYHNQVGRILLYTEKFELAEAEFKAASQLNGEESAYPFNLGLALSLQQKFYEAIEPLKRAIALMPTNKKYEDKLAYVESESTKRAVVAQQLPNGDKIDDKR
ncbi:MAG TPA: tetratricopeptide repeat protein [Pseudolabrys sp.]|nr:tetratricopeptide repeat protein [Pseudolabrys sp.]